MTKNYYSEESSQKSALDILGKPEMNRCLKMTEDASLNIDLKKKAQA